MDTIQLPQDFKEFIQLLNSHGVEYLLVGGYAVGLHGFPRATGDIDIWIAFSPANLTKTAQVLRQFGLAIPDPLASFLNHGQFLSMGNSPLRIDILTVIDGVSFDDCFKAHKEFILHDIPIKVIGLEHLKLNKSASGRLKDRNDLRYLSQNPENRGERQ